MTAGTLRRPTSRRRTVRRHLPPQHGAWAMLVVPFGVGVALSGPAWVHVPLLVAWLGGYLLSYFALLAVKTRRVGRVRSQLVLYAALTVPAALVVVLARPQLLVVAPLYAVLLAVNVGYAWRRDERSVVNDLASVGQATLMVPVAAVAGGVAAAAALPAALVVLLYFAGTVLYVKTMIRERGRVGWVRASVLFHAAALVVTAAVAWPLGLLFAWFLLRAAAFPRRTMTPKQVGLVEIANSAALLVLVPLLA